VCKPEYLVKSVFWLSAHARVKQLVLVPSDWIVSRQGPRTGASHRRGDDYGAA